MTTFFLDFEGGNDANDGLTFANRWKTLTAGPTAARIAPGDTVRIMASPDPVDLGDATWTNGSAALTLPNPAAIKTVDECESGWTAAANITLSYPNTPRMSGNSLFITAQAAFTTGKIAHKALAGGSQNFSAYR